MTTQLQADSRVLRSPHAVWRVVDEEAVIVEPREGMVNVISETASRIWALADGINTVSAISKVIAAEYDISPQQALADTLGFLTEMREKNLVESGD